MSALRRSTFSTFIIALLSFGLESSLQASSSVTLAWNPNTEHDLAGYRLYVGTTSGQYSQSVEVPNATSATVENLAEQQIYYFAVTAYNTAGAESLPSSEVAYTVPSLPPAPNRQALLNISTRAFSHTGSRAMVGGFIIGDGIPKRVLLRGLGPSLSVAGVGGVIADPALELYDSTGALIAGNDNWSSASLPPGMAPPRRKESALVATLPPGSYTVALRGSTSSTGVALFELYDLDPTASRIRNISSRAEVGTGDNVMVGGFIVGAGDSTRVLIRAIGPSLAAAGVARSLQDPILELHNANGSLLFENDNWRDTQASQIIASTIPPSDDREAAIIATLAPGNYTAVVRGVSNSAGVALVEVYNLESD